MSQIITNSILIYGNQGGGKTMFGVMLALNYIGRIYGNVKIQEDDKEIVAFIKEISFLKTLSFSGKPGVIVFDEVGLNFNSKEHGSKKNKDLSFFFFLIRKYNLSGIFISQRLNSIPVDIRELATHIYHLSVVNRKNKHPLFRVTREQIVGVEGMVEFVDEYIFDFISYFKKYGITYNSLEASIID